MTIELRDVSFRYDLAPVLEGVSGRVEAGRVHVITGPNAAGKSTLLRLMLGLRRPTTGSVRVDDRPIDWLRGAERANRLAYVAQRPSVAAALSVRHVISLGRYALAGEQSRVDEAIERFELGAEVDRAYAELSVGQQQRVALARAWAQVAPEGHLLLDEPTSAMDLRHETRAVEHLRQAASDGVAVVAVIHDLTLAAAWADVVWLLRGGRLVADGAPDEVLTPERLAEVFEVPFVWLDGVGGERVLVARR